MFLQMRISGLCLQEGKNVKTVDVQNHVLPSVRFTSVISLMWCKRVQVWLYTNHFAHHVA
jgi:hypothetical protein